MTDNKASFWILFVAIASFLAWQKFGADDRLSDIERAEFKVSYSAARDRLDAYSRCPADRSLISRERNDKQVMLQKRFATLRDEIDATAFKNERQIADLEIQIRDRNPSTRMEDDTVRCERLAYLDKNEEAEIIGAIADVRRLLEARD